MSRSAETPPYRQILIDIDTQSHFFCHHSSVCIRNPRRILANVRKVMHWAQTHHIPTISTLQVHPDQSLYPQIPRTCRLSQRKPACTVSQNHLSLSAADTLDWSIDTWDRYDQVIIQKRCFDPFEEPRADRIFTELPVEEYILIGTPLEGAVKATVLGLLMRRKKITLVTNAVGTLDRISAPKLLNFLGAKGVRLIKVNALLGAQILPATTRLH